MDHDISPVIPAESPDFDKPSPVETDGVFNPFQHSENSLMSESSWLEPISSFCRKPAPIQWLIKRWLPEKSLIMVHGASGSGKTFLVLDWCLRIASDEYVWADYPVHHGSVVYLAGEGHAGLRGRITAWMQHHKVEEIDMLISKSGTDLDTKEGLEMAIESILSSGYEPKLIVVDTLHRFMSGDENSARDTRALITSCAKLMEEFNCSVLLVHHNGVSDNAQSRARGSSAWKAALDLEVWVNNTNSKSNLTVRQLKNKDGELADDAHFQLVPIHIAGWFDDEGKAVTSAVLQKIEPKAIQRSTQIKKDISELNDAWLFSGNHVIEGKPYLPKKEWKKFLIEQEGRTKKGAHQAVKASSTGIASRLTRNGIIKNHQEGVLVIDPDISSHMLTGTNGTHMVNSTTGTS